MIQIGDKIINQEIVIFLSPPFLPIAILTRLIFSNVRQVFYIIARNDIASQQK